MYMIRGDGIKEFNELQSNTVISLQLKQNKQTKKNIAEVLLCYLKSLEFTS